jgi:hypothetical protein
MLARAEGSATQREWDSGKMIAGKREGGVSEVIGLPARRDNKISGIYRHLGLVASHWEIYVLNGRAELHPLGLYRGLGREK